MKKIYYIEYYDKMHNIKMAFVKAKNINDAEKKFYLKNPYTLIRKISLN